MLDLASVLVSSCPLWNTRRVSLAIKRKVFLSVSISTRQLSCARFLPSPPQRTNAGPRRGLDSHCDTPYRDGFDTSFDVQLELAIE